MTSVPPSQPPAAPESDVSALRGVLAAATPGPWVQNDPPRHAKVRTTGLPDDLDDEIATTIEASDAALIVAAVNALPALLADLTAARERVRVVEGERETLAEQYAAEVEELEADVIAEETRANENATLVHRERARAESSEAAHEALRKGIEALADEWERVPNGFGPYDGPVHREAATLLRALLAGGDS